MATAEAESEIDKRLRLEAGGVCDLLDGLFGKFAAGYENIGLKVHPVPKALANVALSYVHDLHRYKTYHPVEVPDRARRASYMCKWIMKLRPVHVSSEYVGKTGRYYMNANEIFAIEVASTILHINLGTVLSSRMLDILLYTLRFRTASEDTFILFFGSLCGLN